MNWGGNYGWVTLRARYWLGLILSFFLLLLLFGSGLTPSGPILPFSAFLRLFLAFFRNYSISAK